MFNTKSFIALFALAHLASGLSSSLNLGNNAFLAKVYLKNGLDECRIAKFSPISKPKSINEDQSYAIQKHQLVHFEKGTSIPDDLDQTVYNIMGLTEEDVKKALDSICKNKPTFPNKSLERRDSLLQPYTEVKKMLSSGNSTNRIDVVFMGDGYTLLEKSKFFDDIDYLVKKIFEGVTFESFFPVYNVWAVFVESKDSGITKGSVKKDTAFNLRRDGAELRAIFYPDETLQTCQKFCDLTGEKACDYRVIIANDEFYGGLGGDVIISTSSKRSGSVVLNHEMGHTFADVGDEYDNSWAYFGANSEETKNANDVKWKHWIKGPLREERSQQRLLLYPWYDLSKGPYETTFTSDGQFNRWFIRFGISGADEEDAISVSIDGQPIPWNNSKTVDRVFSEYLNETSGFSRGNHTLRVVSLKPPKSGNPTHMFTSVTLLEVGTEEEFKFEGENYSLYPTWDDHLVKRFRPVNEHCVMRNMSSSNFCNVCKESLWLQYFDRISLIDDLSIQKNVITNNSKQAKISLKTMPFAQFRPNPSKFKEEKINVKWFKDGMLVSKYNNKFEINLPTSKCNTGNWSVNVTLSTPEVRKDPKKLLTASKAFKI